MYNDFVSKSENLNGAVLVVDNPSVARNLKDTAGNAVFKGHISADGTIGTVEGIPVRVQNMNGKGLAVLMREDAYAVSVSRKSFELDTIVDDTELAKKSAISVYGSVMASGMVVNPSAIKILTAGVQTNTEAPVEVENPVETENATSGIDPEIDAKVKAILMKDIEEELKAQGINEKPTSIEILPMDDNLKPKTTKTRKAKVE